METAYNFGDRSAMIQNTGPFTLAPGETDTLVVATMMGFSRSELFANARMAHQIFSSGWIVPEAPLQPAVEKEENSGEIVLRWGRISEDDSLNALLGRQEFEGYKIYRSTDGGLTWGTPEVIAAHQGAFEALRGKLAAVASSVEAASGERYAEPVISGG